MEQTTSPDPSLVTVVVGTRPEFVKMAPVIDAIRDSSALTLRLVHTGQHYDRAMSGGFFEALSLPEPDVHLGIGSGSHAEQTGMALQAIERDVVNSQPAVVLAQGDTNAVVSAALATAKLDPRFGHVEAGIRSYDRSMPEEVNRIVADHLADLRFAPTDVAAENLARENITENVHVTGNTIVDACRANLETAERTTDVRSRLDLDPDAYVVATIHRPLNTDYPDRLATILEALDGHDAPVVFPAHPRTRVAIKRLGFEPTGALELLSPLDYLDFLDLLSNARVVVTDSGGIQEEAAVLEVPCLTVRPNTERPETVDARVNELVEPGALSDRLRSVYHEEHESMDGATTLYGDGTAGKQIVDLLQTAVGTVQERAR